jgi:hypothetical protein
MHAGVGMLSSRIMLLLAAMLIMLLRLLMARPDVQLLVACVMLMMRPAVCISVHM